MVVKLLVSKGAVSLREVTLRRQRTVVGRKKGCKLQIRSQLVSRIHCVLVCEATRVSVKDLGSSNGTFVNGRMIKEQFLQAGDILQIGPLRFVVQIDGVPNLATRRARGADERTVADEDEVVFFEADEDELRRGEEEGAEARLVEDVADAAEFITVDEEDLPDHGVGRPSRQDSQPVEDAADLLVPDDAPSPSDAAYGLAEEEENRGPSAKDKKPDARSRRRA